MSLLIQQAPGQQYLQTSDGVPWQLRGDSPWELMIRTQEAGAVEYFENRKAKGFNSGLMELIATNTPYSPNAPANAYGDLPFTGTPFQSSLNTPYWDYVRFCVETARDNDYVCQLVPNYIGFGGGSEGWWSAMVAAGPSNVAAYGAAVATLLGDLDNIIWVNGGDWYPTANFDLITAQATGILSVDTRHLYTTHWARNSIATDGGPYSWLTLNNSYPDQATVSSLLLTGYQNNPSYSTYSIEARYEGSFSGQPTLNAKDVRVESWAAALQGGRSDNYGNHTVWPFAAGWQTALNSAGAFSIAAKNAFMQSIKWWLLRPDAANAMIQAGGRGTLGTTNYVSAARAVDGSLGAANIPAGGSFTANNSALAAPYDAYWIDPSNGARTHIGRYNNTGTQGFTTPGNNADGQPDWTWYAQTDLAFPVGGFGFWSL